MVGAPTINEKKGRSRLDPKDGRYRRLPFYVDFPDLPPVLLDETAEDRTLLGTVWAARSSILAPLDKSINRLSSLNTFTIKILAPLDPFNLFKEATET